MEAVEERTQPLLITVGADIGQKRDPTALCVTEAQERETGRTIDGPLLADGHSFDRTNEVATYYVVRHIERLPLGTSYPEVGKRIAAVTERLEASFPHATLSLLLDATGVGAPVVDIVRSQVESAGTRFTVTAATFTGTERLEGYLRGRELRVGKVWLVSRLQALLQTGRIRLPKTAETKALARELADYEIRVNEHANLVTGAFRTGAHDDMVTALGLTVLAEPHRYGPVTIGPRLWD